MTKKNTLIAFGCSVFVFIISLCIIDAVSVTKNSDSQLVRIAMLNIEVFYLKVIVLFVLCLLIFVILYKALYTNAIRDVIAVFGAAIILFFPAVVGWGSDFALPDTENRAMAEKPEFSGNSASEYISKLNAYISDTVPFRKVWLRNNGLVKYGLFHSSLNVLSMPGKAGWIYIGGSGLGNGEDTVADYKKTNLFSREELENLSDSLQGFKNYLFDNGIEFRLMITLNKSHIYPEYLPSELKQSEGKTRAEQLIAYLEENTDIQIIYPKKELLEAKEEYLLYCPTDAHWNTVGGYVGFTQLMASLNPDKSYPPIKEISPVYQKTNWADVSNIINSAWFTDNIWSNTSYESDIPLEWTYRTEENNSLYINNQLGNGEKLLVYHDSYMNQMMDYLGKEYTECEFIEKKFQITEMDLEQKNPDVVVFEILERMLNNYTDELSYWKKYK